MTVGLMQPASEKAIDAATARLAVAFQRQIDAGTVRVYRETMSDLPQWAIEAAELQLRRTGGTFFPSAPEWHAAAVLEVRTREREQLFMCRPTPGVYVCDACRDTGWLELERDDRLVHVACGCRPTNLAYQRNTRSSRKGNVGGKA